MNHRGRRALLVDTNLTLFHLVDLKYPFCYNTRMVNKMIYKVKKITGQYNGHGHFKYLIQPKIFHSIDNRNSIAEWREWCWATWGPSRELLWAIASTPDVVWSWDTDHDNKRIYLKSDAELLLFQLKW